MLRLKVGRCETRRLERTRSALTGNPLASSIARVAIENSLLLARGEFEGVCGLNDDCILDIQSWSDKRRPGSLLEI